MSGSSNSSLIVCRQAQPWLYKFVNLCMMCMALSTMVMMKTLYLMALRQFWWKQRSIGNSKERRQPKQSQVHALSGHNPGRPCCRITPCPSIKFQNSSLLGTFKMPMDRRKSQSLHSPKTPFFHWEGSLHGVIHQLQMVNSHFVVYFLLQLHIIRSASVYVPLYMWLQSFQDLIFLIWVLKLIVLLTGFCWKPIYYSLFC